MMGEAMPGECPTCCEPLDISSLESHMRQSHLGSLHKDHWACGHCAFKSEDMVVAGQHCLRRGHDVAGLTLVNTEEAAVLAAVAHLQAALRTSRDQPGSLDSTGTTLGKVWSAQPDPSCPQTRSGATGQARPQSPDPQAENCLNDSAEAGLDTGGLNSVREASPIPYDLTADWSDNTWMSAQGVQSNRATDAMPEDSGMDSRDDFDSRWSPDIEAGAPDYKDYLDSSAPVYGEQFGSHRSMESAASPVPAENPTFEQSEAYTSFDDVNKSTYTSRYKNRPRNSIISARCASANCRYSDGPLDWKSLLDGADSGALAQSFRDPALFSSTRLSIMQIARLLDHRFTDSYTSIPAARIADFTPSFLALTEITQAAYLVRDTPRNRRAVFYHHHSREKLGSGDRLKQVSKVILVGAMEGATDPGTTHGLRPPIARYRLPPEACLLRYRRKVCMQGQIYRELYTLDSPGYRSPFFVVQASWGPGLVPRKWIISDQTHFRMCGTVDKQDTDDPISNVYEEQEAIEAGPSSDKQDLGDPISKVYEEPEALEPQVSPNIECDSSTDVAGSVVKTTVETENSFIQSMSPLCPPDDVTQESTLVCDSSTDVSSFPVLDSSQSEEAEYPESDFDQILAWVGQYTDRFSGKKRHGGQFSLWKAFRTAEDATAFLRPRFSKHRNLKTLVNSWPQTTFRCRFKKVPVGMDIAPCRVLVTLLQLPSASLIFNTGRGHTHRLAWVPGQYLAPKEKEAPGLDDTYS